jgi:hypothetical protein
MLTDRRQTLAQLPSSRKHLARKHLARKHLLP